MEAISHEIALQSIAFILWGIGALIVAFGMFAVYAVKEHSKRNLTVPIVLLWILVSFGGVLSTFQALNFLKL